MTDHNWNDVSNGANGDYLDPAQWTPGDVPLYSSDDAATISAGIAILSNAEPNNITLTLGREPVVLITFSPGFDSGIMPPLGPGLPLTYPILALSNGALGPDMTLDAVGLAGLRVNGYDTNYGTINVVPFIGGQTPVNGNALFIDTRQGTQLNQEGTISVTSSRLFIEGLGTLNNDGQIFIGPGSVGVFDTSTIGSGTITVDHADVSLNSAASTQTVDLLGGTLRILPTLEATIKDWNNDGQLAFAPAFGVNAVQFNQTSDAGGDLQLFGASGQVGDVHLLGTYATADFTVTQSRVDASINVAGHPSA